MDHEDLENRIEHLEKEVKEKLTWNELIWTVLGVLIVIKIIDYLPIWGIVVIFVIGGIVWWKI